MITSLNTDIRIVSSFGEWGELDWTKYEFFISDTEKNNKKDPKTKNGLKEEDERYILCGHCKNKITLPLYEIDILYKELAEKHGIRLTRCESLNTSEKFISAMKELVLSAVAGSQ